MLKCLSFSERLVAICPADNWYSAVMELNFPTNKSRKACSLRRLAQSQAISGVSTVWRPLKWVLIAKPER